MPQSEEHNFIIHLTRIVQTFLNDPEAGEVLAIVDEDQFVNIFTELGFKRQEGFFVMNRPDVQKMYQERMQFDQKAYWEKDKRRLFGWDENKKK